MIAIWMICAVGAAVWAARCPPHAAPYRRRVLLAAAAFGPCLLAVDVGLRFAAWTMPWQRDQFLFAVDGAYGFQASFAVGRWFARWPVLSFVCRWAYDWMHIAVLVMLLRQAWQDPTWRFARVLAADFLIAYGLYFLLPAAGPAYAFAAKFPHSTPVITAPAATKLFAFPNAMPSVHFATVLLMFWNAGVFRYGRTIFAVPVAFVGLAALGTGEHYLVDLVVAVPYAVMVQSLARARFSWPAALFVAGWILVLRFRPDILIHSPALLRLLSVVTVGLVLVCGAGTKLPKPRRKAVASNG